MSNATATATADKGFTIDTAMRLTKRYVKGNTPVMLWSPPGVGKSEGLREIAAEEGANVIDFRLNLRESVDIRGLPQAHGETTRWLKPSELPFEGTDHPDNSWLFMDEINTASPQLMATAMQLVLERRAGEHVLKPGVRIVAAGNRQKDRASANKMPSALANRFAHLDVVPDVDTWCTWANRKDVHAAFVAFMRFRPHFIHIMPGATVQTDNGEISMPIDSPAFPTPRSITDAAQYAGEDAEIRMPLIAGRVGQGFAVEFEGFIRTWLDLPRISDILADPLGARVPQGPGALYALATAVARKATPTNFGTFLQYITRVPKPYETLMVVDAQNRDKTICETGAYVNWCGANQGVFA